MIEKIELTLEAQIIKKTYAKKYKQEHRAQFNEYMKPYMKKRRKAIKNIEEVSKMELEKKIRDAKATYQREWYAANLEKQRAYRKIYRSEHKEEQKCYVNKCWNKKALALEGEL